MNANAAAVTPASSERATVKALTLGTTVHEYRIDEVLGTGSFGITYKATDTHLSIPVALKEFLPHQYVQRSDTGEVTATDRKNQYVFEWGLSRFIGEAQVLAQFKHPNIVRVSRYFNANNTAYIVMDYEEGGSLYDYLEDLQEPVDEERLTRIFLPILEGLSHVHEKRYLHRDIKPGNIYMRQRGTPMLIDFGAARMDIGGNAVDLANVLTPGYAPPEQYDQDAEQGPASDIYALGATMYRCIVGKPPIESTERVQAIADAKPDPLTAAVDLAADGFSRAFLAAIDTMLQLDYDKRPAAAEDAMALFPGIQIPEPSTSIFYTPPGQQHKVVFIGPPAVGKTRALQTLSSTQTVTTTRGKHSVAMEYGAFDDAQRRRVHLYTVPGRAEFAALTEPTLKGTHGVVIFVDSTSRHPLRELDKTLYRLRDFLRTHACAIAVTSARKHHHLGNEQIYRHLAGKHAEWPGLPPVFTVDPNNREHLTLLLDALFCIDDPGIDDYDL